MIGTSPLPSMTRRSWIATSVAGMVLGGIWGAGIGALALPKKPTLAVVGRQSAQIILLDTLSARVLIVLGDPDAGLVDQVPALMTIMRQRIDIVIGTAPGTAALGESFAFRWNVSQTIVIPDTIGSSPGPNTSTRSTSSQSTAINLDRGVSLSIDITTRGGWNGLPPQSLWSVTVVHGRHTVVLGPDEASLLATAPDRLSLIIVPAVSGPSFEQKLSPGSIAINENNHREMHQRAHGTALVRTYPEDIARFVFAEDGIELPFWASSGVG